ncbi:MAG: tRNA 4-thiouridine(8) synthase ThiI [Proteobacteria bacterium]|nr:MAG: tRNA 4-thiouridine(8) synthase ThiI [Pseudomonadota bacterium]
MQKILIHFAELSLKGKNKRVFEKKMSDNLKRLLKPLRLIRKHDRTILEMEHIDDAMLDHLALIPGISNFAVMHEAKSELDDIRAVAERVVRETFGDVSGKSFRLKARRSDKRFPITSPELNFEVGGYLKNALDLTVDLSNPDITVHVEVTHDGSFIYTDKRKGAGGLPVGSSGKGVVLFSGGIDSPVAAYTMMKRGMKVTLVHLYNSTINRDFSKIKNLAKCLSQYQGRTRLLMIDLEEFQRHAIAMVPDKYRMIIYKRQMIRSAAEVAAEIHAYALITGDSLGQVASQTVENIRAIYDVSPLPLLSPLIGFDKEEIITVGKRIGTYEISIEEYCDICSYLIAKHPETRGKPEEVAEFEKLLPLQGLDCIRKEAFFDNGQEVIRKAQG